MSNKQTDEQGKPLTYWGGLNNDHIVDANKKVSSIEWFSNQSYELFEQYSEGNFNRTILNKLMVEATEQAKEMHKQEIVDAYSDGAKGGANDGKGQHKDGWVSIQMKEKYYKEHFGK
jgi:hypothetical protein